MLAWLFKPYLGKVYLKDSAKVVNAQDMIELIVNFFEYASENEQVDSKKMTIRIGSPHEDKLIILLCTNLNPKTDNARLKADRLGHCPFSLKKKFR
jgi:hypothetical protein